MNKTALLIKHEFLSTIRRKAFIILTIAFPLLALLGILAAQVIPKMITPSVTIEKIGYVDNTGIFSGTLTENQLQLVQYNNEDTVKTALIKKDITDYFVIPANYLATGLVQHYTLKNEIIPSTAAQTVVRDFLLSNLLKGNDAAIINRAKSPLNIASITLTGTGAVAPRQGGFAALILPYIFSILLLMAIFMSSGYLLQGLGEEKENRVMEILLSSVSPKELLAGKVIGLGAAGLLQIIIWLISADFILKIAPSTFGNVIGSLQVTPDFLILGIVYFILGYLLMAVLMAAVGSVSATAREGQQMSAFFIIPVLIPVYFMSLIMQYPESIVVKILTFIPFTAPITVIVRLGLSQIPIWELGLSILILIITIWGCFVLATKLFRTYLLMYGKRPDLKAIIQSFRNA